MTRQFEPSGPLWPFVITRRSFIGGATAAVLLAGCGGDEETTTAPTGTAPSVKFSEPDAKLSGSLKILMWSHFVPRHDKWFDKFRGRRDRRPRIASEISAGSGHDVIQFIGPLPQFEPSVVDMSDLTKEAQRRWGDQIELCLRCSENPTTKKFFAYSPGWVPDPGNYRKSMWEKAGFPNGPSTWDELKEGGSKIKSDQGIQLGIGMSQEIDSDMVGRSLMWSLGGQEQDERERGHQLARDRRGGAVHEGALRGRHDRRGLRLEPRLEQPGHGRRQAVLHRQLDLGLSHDPEGQPAAGERHPLRQGARGTGGGARRTARDVQLDRPGARGEPGRGAGVPAALHGELRAGHMGVRAVRLPGVPQPGPAAERLAGQRSVRLRAARQARGAEGRTRLEHQRRPSRQFEYAIGEVFGTFIVPNMYARAARGQQTPEESVARAESQMQPIFAKWREKGLIGGAA